MKMKDDHVKEKKKMTGKYNSIEFLICIINGKKINRQKNE